MKVIQSLLLTLVVGGLSIVISCAQTKTVQESNHKLVMTVSNADFDIILDAMWTRRDTRESFEWEDEKNMQELLVSVLSANEPMNPELRISTAKRLMEIRLNAINQISEGKAQMGEVEKTEGDEFIELSAYGVDKAYGIQIYTTVVVRPQRAVTFSYYKYSPLLTDEAFHNKSKELRSALKVH
jgi:hypothetical protein